MANRPLPLAASALILAIALLSGCTDPPCQKAPAFYLRSTAFDCATRAPDPAGKEAFE